MLSIWVRNKDHNYLMSLQMDQSYDVIELTFCSFTSGRMDSKKLACDLES